MRTLLDDVEDFLKVHRELSPAQLGRAALKDTCFVKGLRKGRSPREKTALRLRQWMAKYAEEAKRRDEASRSARKRVERMAREVAAPRAADAVT